MVETIYKSDLWFIDPYNKGNDPYIIYFIYIIYFNLKYNLYWIDSEHKNSKSAWSSDLFQSSDEWFLEHIKNILFKTLYITI